jgi:cell wall-associated NlpC family hydrolase
MHTRSRALIKVTGAFLVAATLTANLPQIASADPVRASTPESTELKGPKNAKRKRSAAAHGFGYWTRRVPGRSFGALPVAARRTPAEIAVATARAQIGKPYRWGALGPSAFDCSGLTRYAWAAAGVHLAHSSRGQFGSLRRVDLDDLSPGDLVYRPGHIGIYVGKGRMIHAPQSGRRVQLSGLGRVIGAVRPR